MSLRDRFDLTPRQYHGGVDKLWKALGITGVQDEDIFTLAARAIEDSKTLKTFRIRVQSLLGPAHQDRIIYACNEIDARMIAFAMYGGKSDNSTKESHIALVKLRTEVLPPEKQKPNYRFMDMATNTERLCGFYHTFPMLGTFMENDGTITFDSLHAITKHPQAAPLVTLVPPGFFDEPDPKTHYRFVNMATNTERLCGFYHTTLGTFTENGLSTTFDSLKDVSTHRQGAQLIDLVPPGFFDVKPEEKMTAAVFAKLITSEFQLARLLRDHRTYGRLTRATLRQCHCGRYVISEWWMKNGITTRTWAVAEVECLDDARDIYRNVFDELIEYHHDRTNVDGAYNFVVNGDSICCKEHRS